MRPIKVRIHTCAGLELEHVSLVVERPDPRECAVEVAHNRVAASSQHFRQAFTADQAGPDVQVELRQLDALSGGGLRALPLGDVAEVSRVSRPEQPERQERRNGDGAQTPKETPAHVGRSPSQRRVLATLDFVGQSRDLAHRLLALPGADRLSRCLKSLLPAQPNIRPEGLDPGVDRSLELDDGSLSLRAIRGQSSQVRDSSIDFRGNLLDPARVFLLAGDDVTALDDLRLSKRRDDRVQLPEDFAGLEDQRVERGKVLNFPGRHNGIDDQDN